MPVKTTLAAIVLGVLCLVVLVRIDFLQQKSMNILAASYVTQLRIEQASLNLYRVGDRPTELPPEDHH